MLVARGVRVSRVSSSSILSHRDRVAQNGSYITELRRWRIIPSAGPDDSGTETMPDIDRLRKKFFEKENATAPIQDDSTSSLDSVNPIALGRSARRAFDEVWQQLSQLTSPTKSFSLEDEMGMGYLVPAQGSDGLTAPQAAYTTVLVVGATGRVGRIVTRKLLLRGYRVRALVRRKEGRQPGNIVEGVPAAVGVILGDVGEMRDCQEAVRGVNKVIYCASAKSAFTADLLRVEETGVKNITKAFQDECMRQAESNLGKRVAGTKAPIFTSKSKREIADFSRPYHQTRWDITFVGSTEDEALLSDRSREMSKYNQAVAEINDEENLIFEGVLYQRGAVAEVGANINSVLPGGDHRTADTEGLVMRLRGDGKQYALVIKTRDESRYVARFSTRPGYLHIRIPWTAFRSESASLGKADSASQAPLEPGNISYIGLRCEPLAIPMRYEFRRAAALAASRSARGAPSMEEVEAMKKDRQFQLEVDWIKALPGGSEPDVVLVSCAGKASDKASEAELQKLVEFKRRGEDILRISGLGYTIIRPGMLVDEPGGYKALVFDQGDRITESVGAADVADICLRSLHESAARNKTFDVCYEFQSEAGLGMYEVVAHVPTEDRGGGSSYLAAAVSTLAKNT